MAKAERKASPMDKNKFEADSLTAIDGPPPGSSSLTGSDISFETLGFLSEFPSLTDLRDTGEGVGEFIVCLHEVVRGAAEHDVYAKGSVVRISKVIPQFEDPTTDREIIRARIRRLFDLGAIRIAAKNEVKEAYANGGKISVNMMTETQEVQAERARRIDAEQENEVLRQKLQDAMVARDNLSPEKAGASEAANAAAASENTVAEQVVTDPASETKPPVETWD